MTDLALTGVAYAFAEWGMWKARCPRPGCTSAMALVRDQLVFTCLGPHSCGFEAPVIWPADPDAIEAILAMRPLAANQNWLVGETLEDLLAENAAHACLPPEWMAVEQRTLILATADQRATDGLLLDVLPAADPRRQLRAARALAHDSGLPFVEPDGVVSFPPHPELED